MILPKQWNCMRTTAKSSMCMTVAWHWETSFSLTKVRSQYGWLNLWRHGGLLVVCLTPEGACIAQSKPQGNLWHIRLQHRLLQKEWSGFESWRGVFCSVLGQHTVLSQRLSPPWCIKHYQQIYCWWVILLWMLVSHPRRSKNIPSCFVPQKLDFTKGFPLPRD